MALLVKNSNRPLGSTGNQPALLEQFLKLTQPAVALPATTTGQLFRVKGGRVLVKALVAEVTTAVQAQACNFKVSAKKLDNSSVAVGTAVDVASNVDVNGIALGSHVFVEGDGTAAVISTAGAVLIGTNSGYWICEQGEIYVTTSATNTGALKYDLYYQPLDPGAYVEVAPLTAGALTAAI